MTFGYSFYILVPLLLFPTAGPNGAPRWRKGWPVSFVFFFLLWAGFITAIILHKKRYDPSFWGALVTKYASAEKQSNWRL